MRPLSEFYFWENFQLHSKFLAIFFENPEENQKTTHVEKGEASQNCVAALPLPSSTYSIFWEF